MPQNPTPHPSARIAERVARLLGARPVAWTAVARGYTAAERWVVRTEDGRSAFVKAGANANTCGWLRAEWQVYAAIQARWLAGVLGWEDDGDVPLLLLEDLSQAHWPPPWTRAQVDVVLAMLADVAATPPPATLPTLESQREDLMGWTRVAGDLRPFLALDLCSPAWLAAALPALLRADATANLAGDDLLHLDVRSDNICFAGDRAVLVDWNWACRGNARLDVVAWLPSLRMEGGPLPDEIVGDEPELAALIAGFFAHYAASTATRVRAGETQSQRLLALQVGQLKIALPWAARALGLPPPDRMTTPA